MQLPDRPSLIGDSHTIPYLDRRPVVRVTSPDIQTFAAITDNGVIANLPLLIGDPNAVPYLDSRPIVRARPSHVQAFAAVANNSPPAEMPLLIGDSDAIPYLDGRPIVRARPSHVQAFASISGDFGAETQGRRKEREDASERAKCDAIRSLHLEPPDSQIMPRPSRALHVETKRAGARGRIDGEPNPIFPGNRKYVSEVRARVSGKPSGAGARL